MWSELAAMTKHKRLYWTWPTAKVWRPFANWKGFVYGVNSPQLYNIIVPRVQFPDNLLHRLSGYEPDAENKIISTETSIGLQLPWECCLPAEALRLQLPAGQQEGFSLHNLQTFSKSCEFMSAHRAAYSLLGTLAGHIVTKPLKNVLLLANCTHLIPALPFQALWICCICQPKPVLGPQWIIQRDRPYLQP